MHVKCLCTLSHSHTPPHPSPSVVFTTPNAVARPLVSLTYFFNVRYMYSCIVPHIIKGRTLGLLLCAHTWKQKRVLIAGGEQVSRTHLFQDNSVSISTSPELRRIGARGISASWPWSGRPAAHLGLRKADLAGDN